MKTRNATVLSLPQGYLFPVVCFAVAALLLPVGLRAAPSDGTVDGELKVTGSTTTGYGSAVVNIGDVDGGGIDDLAVGSDGDASVRILFMNANGTVASQVTITEATVLAAGASVGSADRFGNAIAALGDLNGDGVPDIAVGETNGDVGGSNNGAVHILFLDSSGGITGGTPVTIAENLNGFPNSSLGGDRFGSGVASLGDLDGVGTTELALAIGARRNAGAGSRRGAVWIVFIDISIPGASTTVTATVSSAIEIDDNSGDLSGLLVDNDELGTSVAALGDLGSNGTEELAVGFLEDDGNADAGGVIILSITSAGAYTVLNVISDTDLGGGVLAASDRFGFSVSGAEDLDEDGVNDLIAGADGDDDGSTDRGAIWVVFLNSNGTVKGTPLRISAGDNGFTGPLADSDRFGVSVGALGDIDGDGIADLGVGATGDTSGAGAVYLLYLASAALECVAGGPYTGVTCVGPTTSILLDGTGSSTGGGVTYQWSTDCAGGTFTNGTSLTTATLDLDTSLGPPPACEVTLTVSESGSPDVMCSADVSLVDTTDPTAMCQVFTLELDASGSGTLAPGDVDDGSSDSCSDVTLSLSKTSFSCSDVGSEAVTLTVEDASMNSVTCDATVTVEDNVNPNASCMAFTAELDATGNVSITGADVDDGSSDACGIASLTVSPNAFTCNEIGVQAVTLTVTDNHGNESTCDASVTVEDNVDPTAICTEASVELDGSGNASITAADVDNGSSDACGIAMLSVSPDTFTCNDIGANEVTLTVTDNNGNESTCTTTVTVTDSENPLAVCMSATVELDASGNGSITAAEVDDGSTDNCGIASLSVAPSTFDCSDVPGTMVTLTVTDASGNEDTCDVFVTVNDNVDPMALCRDFPVQLDINGNASITAAQVDNGSDDACGIDTLEISPDTFSCSDVGPRPVTLTVTDNNGNTDTCVATVTVEDNEQPTALCKDITVQLDAGGTASILAADVDDGSSDACGIASLSVSPDSFTCGDVGSNSVTLTVTDENGNVATCGATVMVEDLVPPVAMCQTTIVQLDASGNGSLTAADVDGGSTDNCGITSMTASPNTFTCSDVGSVPVMLTVMDAAGMSDSCVVNVTVQDMVSPTAMCTNISVPLDAGGMATIVGSDVDGGSSDACGIGSLSVSPDTFTCSNVGQNTVTLTVTDVNGNESTCEATVTVEDTMDPIASCKNTNVQAGTTGSVTITPGDIDDGSTDNCGIASMTVTPDTFTCDDTGDVTVTLEVVDVNGRTATCEATVTVQDKDPPTAVCRDTTVQLDASGNGSIVAADIDDGSSDPCGILSLEVSPNTFTCASPGTVPVVLTVRDLKGNFATCGSTVTVLPPVLICDPGGAAGVYTQNATGATTDVVLSGAGSTGAVSYLWTSLCGAVFVDSGTMTSTLPSPTVTLDTSGTGPFTCDVELVVTDICNNDSSPCTAMVTVTDDTPDCEAGGPYGPVECNSTSMMVALDGAGSSTGAGVTYLWETTCPDASFDNDASLTPTMTIATDTSLGAPGECDVMLTVTEGGVDSVCESTVTFQDTVPPVLTLVGDEPQILECGDTYTELGATALDACEGDLTALISIDATAVDPTTPGDYSVTYDVSDSVPNMATQVVRTVKVVDTTPPVIALLGDNPQIIECGTSYVGLGATATDACEGDLSLSIQTDSSNVDTTMAGTYMVTYDVSDSVPNPAIQVIRRVEVVDNEDPVISLVGANPQILECGTSYSELGATALDDCEGDLTSSIAVSTAGLDTGAVGNYVVTYNVMDASTNAALEVTRTVMVQDTTAPSLTCPDDISRNTNVGCTLVFEDGGGASRIDGGLFVSDNCSAAEDIVVTNDAPSSFGPGSHTVVWTATDVAGNSMTCTQIINVNDNEDPVLSCPASLSRAPNDGPNWVPGAGELGTATAIDNCTDTANLILTGNPPATFPPGETIITYTALDEAGNLSSCEQTVTVLDNMAPEVTCPVAMTFQTNAGCTYVGPFGEPLVSDPDTPLEDLVIVNDAPGSFPLGDTNVTWTVTDPAGNVGSCTEIVTTLDLLGPTLFCPPVVNASCDDGQGVVVEFAPTATDNCDLEPTIVCVPPSGSIFPPGITEVACTASDASGNTSSCSFSVQVACGGLAVPGDCNQDAEVDISDAVCLLNFLFLGLSPQLPCGDGSSSDQANIQLLSWTDDGQLDISDVVALLDWKFLGGPAHFLGSTCQPIPGCPSSCGLETSS